MAEKKSSVVDQFIEKKDVPSDQRPVLEALIEFLEERGQFIPKGDLKENFIEKLPVKDKNGIPIVIERCLVCGHDTFEVQKEE